MNFTKQDLEKWAQENSVSRGVYQGILMGFELGIEKAADLAGTRWDEEFNMKYIDLEIRKLGKEE